jgi:hypothetical protein
MQAVTTIGLDIAKSVFQRRRPSRDLSPLRLSTDSGDVLYGRLRPYLNKVAHPQFDGLASAEFIVFPDTQHLCSFFNSILTPKPTPVHVALCTAPKIDRGGPDSDVAKVETKEL